MPSARNENLEYLKQLNSQEKKALATLRTQILKVEPKLEERLCRGVPFFYFLGKRVVGFRASQSHLSFFVMDGKALKSLQAELTGLDVSSTVIRFSASKPLPFRVVQQVVRERLKEIHIS